MSSSSDIELVTRGGDGSDEIVEVAGSSQGKANPKDQAASSAKGQAPETTGLNKNKEVKSEDRAGKGEEDSSGPSKEASPPKKASPSNTSDKTSDKATVKATLLKKHSQPPLSGSSGEAANGSMDSKHLGKASKPPGGASSQAKEDKVKDDSRGASSQAKKDKVKEDSRPNLTGSARAAGSGESESRSTVSLKREGGKEDEGSGKESKKSKYSDLLDQQKGNSDKDGAVPKAKAERSDGQSAPKAKDPGATGSTGSSALKLKKEGAKKPDPSDAKARIANKDGDKKLNQSDAKAKTANKDGDKKLNQSDVKAKIANKEGDKKPNPSDAKAKEAKKKEAAVARAPKKAKSLDGQNDPKKNLPASSKDGSKGSIQGKLPFKPAEKPLLSAAAGPPAPSGSQSGKVDKKAEGASGGTAAAAAAAGGGGAGGGMKALALPKSRCISCRHYIPKVSAPSVVRCTACPRCYHRRCLPPELAPPPTPRQTPATSAGADQSPTSTEKALETSPPSGATPSQAQNPGKAAPGEAGVAAGAGGGGSVTPSSRQQQAEQAEWRCPGCAAKHKNKMLREEERDKKKQEKEKVKTKLPLMLQQGLQGAGQGAVMTWSQSWQSWRHRRPSLSAANSGSKGGALSQH